MKSVMKIMLDEGAYRITERSCKQYYKSQAKEK